MDPPNLTNFDEILNICKSRIFVEYKVDPEYQKFITPSYDNEVILTLTFRDGTSYHTHAIFDPKTSNMRPIPSSITILLTQSEILGQLCKKLSLKDLNNFREANYLDRIECQIGIKDKDKRINFVRSLDDQVYSWMNQVEIFGSNSILRGSYIIDEEKFKFFIDHGADPNCADIHEATLLVKASKYDDLATVKYLIRNKANVDTPDKCGTTSLMIASEKDNLEIVKYLLEHKANINIQDNYGYSALLGATKKGHLEMVEYLVEQGANPLISSIDGETAYDIMSQL